MLFMLVERFRFCPLPGEKQPAYLAEDQILSYQSYRERENHSCHHCDECDCHLHKFPQRVQFGFSESLALSARRPGTQLRSPAYRFHCPLSQEAAIRKGKARARSEDIDKNGVMRIMRAAVCGPANTGVLRGTHYSRP
jgi:hypothetical protein